MNDPIEEPEVLRLYLLGALADDELLTRIEMRLLTDDGSATELATAENDLIEMYLDGELTDEDRERFLKHFLAMPERRMQLRLVENLRKLSVGSEPAPATASPKRWSIGSWFAMPSVRLAFAVAAVILLVFGVWRVAIYQSDTDKGLAQLRAAFKGQRPMEPRITALPDYVPYSETRGNDSVVADPAAHDRADRYLQDATQNAGDAGSHHALALLYLTDKKYDRAIQELDLAIKADPGNPRIQSDAGAAYLQIAKKAADDKNGMRTLEMLNDSVKHLDLAISLAPKMPEPRFNKALCLEMLGAPDPAKSAWQEYLEIDSNSKWADEARRHLERLEQNPIKELSADELESSFLDAMRAGNDDEAAKLLSSNRELIREKYLPQRLAMSYVEAMDDRRDELLQALQYAGKLEIKQAGDPFASEIARFYLAATPVQLEELKQAQADTRTGYANCLSSDYDEALASFEASQKLFDASGDKWEANLARYFVGYALMNNDRSEVAIHEFKSTVEFAHMDGYLWLETTALYWTGATYQKLKQHNLARRSFERALSIAEKINDPYAVHRNLIELARLSALCGRRSMALEYVFQLVQQSNNKQGSLRQRYRDINLVLHALSSERLFDAANAIALEQVAVAESLKDPTWLVEAPTDAGVTFAQVSDFTNARDWLNRGLAATDSIANEKTRIRWKAYSYSKLGDLERSQGNSTEAERLFSKAVEIYNSLDMPAFLAQAQEGLLITDIELGKTDEAEIQIANGIRTVEEYRRSILDEQERAGFLDASQNIYDIAADFEFRRANYESAYDYAEISSSRSLLDWLEKGAIVNRKAHSLAIAVAGDVQPKHLAEIRAGLKTGECVLQYTVLDKKVLIWFVSAEKFSVHEVLIGSDELNDLVSSYTQAILTKDGSTSGGGPEAGRKLYELLVAPVVGEIAGANEVCIVPNKALFELPFAALTSPGGKPLLADIDIVYAPSANVFLHCSKSAEEKAGFENEKVLAVGNPQFESSAFDDLPSLVGAEDEVKNVAAFYPERETLTRQYATKRSFLNALTKANVVQFSGHYIVVPDAPMLSYLLLAKDSDKAEDSMLTNLELAEHKLPRAKLIVLAACRTGSESVSNGEGLIGLSRTFLAADVPLVVASQWSVDTDATAVLMKRFHELRTRERLNTTEALRRAQLEMLNDPSGRFNEPYYWAAFAVYGGHADF